MEKFMGFSFRQPTKKNDEDRELPLFEMEGTDFIVDIARHEFRQVGHEHNRISMGKVEEEFGFDFIYYDTRSKNHYLGSTHELPSYVSVIFIPPIKILDPVGLARRHGFADDYYTGSRLNKKEQLPQLRKATDEKAVKPTQKRKSKKR
ncbi:MAG TPA: hypothetical protein VN040_14130 [Pseudosphingobacterium sp.]|nr:hypothetical protein [Pseudosphingobacterium sp.]